MGYGAFLVRQALFWALLAGLFVGAAVAAATWRVARTRRRERSRARAWTVATLMLTAAVVCATAGLLLPATLELLTRDALIAAGVGLGIGLLGLRFPRAGGIPMLLLMGLLAVAGAWAVRGYRPVRAERELASVTILAMRGDTLSVEAIDPRSPASIPRIVSVPGPGLRAELELADVARGFFLLGAYRFVRSEAFAAAAGSPSSVPESPASPSALPVQPTPPLALLVEHGLARLRTVTAASGSVNILRTYRLVVGPDTEPQFVPDEP